MRMLLPLVATALLTSCALSHDVVSPAVAACRDRVDGYVRLSISCDGYESAEEASTSWLRVVYDETSCDNATAVRDIAGLYDVCLPWLEAADCFDYVDVWRPASCVRQLTFE